VPSGRAVNVVGKRNASELTMRAPRHTGHSAASAAAYDMHADSHGIVDAAAASAAEMKAETTHAVNHGSAPAKKKAVTLEPLYRVQRVTLGGGRGDALAVVFAPGLFGKRPEQVWLSPPLNASSPGWGLPLALQPWAVPLPRRGAMKSLQDVSPLKPRVEFVLRSTLLGQLFWIQDDNVVADLPVWVDDLAYTVASALRRIGRFLGGPSRSPPISSKFPPQSSDEDTEDGPLVEDAAAPRRGLIPRLLSRKSTTASEESPKSPPAATVNALADATSADASAPASATIAAADASPAVNTAPVHTEGYRALLRRLGAAHFLPSSEARYTEQRKELLKEVLPQAIGEQFRARRLLAAEAKSAKDNTDVHGKSSRGEDNEVAGSETRDDIDTAPEVAEVPKTRRRVREYERIRAPVMQP